MVFKNNPNIILALAVLASAVFWCLDGIIDVVFFGDEDVTLLNSIFFPDAHEFYMRGIVLFLFLIFSFYVRSLLIKQENTSQELKKHKNNLQGLVDMRTEQLETLATIDDLTQIYNRRKFFELAKEEISRNSRYKHGLTLIIIDIDHFKKINDLYGHQAGDKTLQHLTNTISSLIRSTDIFGRIGGEEFSLVLPETPKQAAKEYAERMRACIENDKSPNIERITISMGLTQLYDDDTYESAFSRADIALYAAKNNGRNCIVSA